MEIVKKILWVLAGYLTSVLGIMGYYPFLPALYGCYCMSGGGNVYIYGGIAAGIGMYMSIVASVKYTFIIAVVFVGIKLYSRINKQCSSLVAALIVGLSVAVMNLAAISVGGWKCSDLVLGMAEATVAMGATMLMHFALEMATQSIEDNGEKIVTPEVYVADGRIGALSSAVGGLSEAFEVMANPRKHSEFDERNNLEQEVEARVCKKCEGYAYCWMENRLFMTDGLRHMLDSVMEHISVADILEKSYMKGCDNYQSAVEVAVQAFGRAELNQSWYKRLLENRMVIAKQFDAMEELLKEWQNKERSLDSKSRYKRTRIISSAKNIGINVSEVHICEEANGRLKIRGQISSQEGVSSRKYLQAVERAIGMHLRMQKDTPAMISKDLVDIILYEDTDYYVLPGVACQKKNGSSVSGDSYCTFELDDGRYNICLSDGMGSGSRASRESEMLVELLQKFMEAGFRLEAAVKMMNAAMVLKGEDGAFSTLDNATVNLYSGELEIVKIGASATFIKSRDKVEYFKAESLPAGVDMEQQPECIKKTLRDGDFLVMVTDGVLEYLHVNNPEERLADIIGEIGTENAGVLARRILDAVLSCTGGYAMDDMTVITAGIWEK